MPPTSDRHWCRVYDDDLRRDYPQVWHDDRALATWLRLLSVAEKMWPTVPEIPRSVKAQPLDLLVSVGLVQLMPEDCYRIKGLDAERNARRNAASNAAASRWHSGGTSKRSADADADAMPKRDETKLDESPLPRRAGKRMNGTNPRQLGTSPRQQGTSPRQVREAEKQGGAESIHAILTAIQTKGKA